jgi:hypothetical protein
MGLRCFSPLVGLVFYFPAIALWYMYIGGFLNKHETFVEHGQGSIVDRESLVALAVERLIASILVSLDSL